ncbi:MAG: TauD/TfdA family dioxygenase [Chloroflexota bacterium]
MSAQLWTASTLESDRELWTFPLSEQARLDLMTAVDTVRATERPLLDYCRDEFNLGAAQPTIEAAFAEAKHGRGVAVVTGLPREGFDERSFGLLSWGIGLHAGVARPQGKASQYMSEVKDAGTDYRTSTGRGYSSNAELDFHTDSADVVMLTCYNKARAGGMSITTSSAAAYTAMQVEYPHLVEWLHVPVHFSRQGEEAPGEAPSYPHPIFDTRDGRLFSKWNWNRVVSALKLAGVSKIDPRQQEALDTFDQVVRRPELAHSMWLEPGDLQIINSHVTLHSRTNFDDHGDPSLRRLLFRLWISPPDSDHLPESWRVLYGAVEPGCVRGGIIGQAHDEHCKAFEQRQAAVLGMHLPGT